MIGEQDIGHRVVVRRLAGVRGDRRVFADVLGVLARVSESELMVLTRRGAVVVPLGEVHRAKRVPPRRRLPAEIVALERVAAAGWPAPETARLGQWLLRAGAGWTHRANSALVLGEADRPIPEAVAAVVGWYRERGLPPEITTPVPVAAEVASHLAAQGWPVGPTVLVQTAPLPAVLGAPPGDATAGAPEVRLDPAPPAGWLALAASRKGGFPEVARHILTSVPQVRFASAYGAGGDLLAIARGTLDPDRRWLGLTSVEVVPDARRRGLARLLTRSLAKWAYAGGATDAYLQVEEPNQAAVALYARLGFTVHHTYVTRTHPDVTDGQPPRDALC